jgi:para-nitrobenzyl esterase
VTLAGNSAGAAHICHLMGAPAARGLFCRAIGQSSSGFDRAEGGLPTQAQAQARGVAFADSLGLPGLAALRQVSGLELAGAGHFGPVIDGRALTRDTQQVFASGEQAAVPLLVGSNRDEGSVYTQPAAADEVAAQAAASTDGTFGRIYPAADEASCRRSARLYTGDTRFVWPVWRWAVTHARTAPAPAFLYRFERERRRFPRTSTWPPRQMAARVTAYSIPPSCRICGTTSGCTPGRGSRPITSWPGSWQLPGSALSRRAIRTVPDCPRGLRSGASRSRSSCGSPSGRARPLLTASPP